MNDTYSTCMNGIHVPYKMPPVQQYMIISTLNLYIFKIQIGL